MLNCSNCGMANTGTVKFCSNCGASLKESSVSINNVIKNTKRPISITIIGVLNILSFIGIFRILFEPLNLENSFDFTDMFVMGISGFGLLNMKKWSAYAYYFSCVISLVCSVIAPTCKYGFVSVLILSIISCYFINKHISKMS